MILIGRRLDHLVTAADEIALRVKRATAAYPYQCSIRDEVAVGKCIEEIVATHGPVYALVNNAGGQFTGLAEDFSIKGWRAVIDTNLNGTFIVTQAVFRLSFKKFGIGGNVVNITADVANGFPIMAHTGAARAGVENLVRSLAVEWGMHGVRLNCVAPGVILSNGMKNYRPDQLEDFARQRANPAGRLGLAAAAVPVPVAVIVYLIVAIAHGAGTESEVSACVAFLLSPAAAFITGQTLRVDGGASISKKLENFFVIHDKIAPFNGSGMMPDLPDQFKPQAKL